MDFSQHLTDSGYHSNTPAWRNYEFPCGRGANVWLSATPFRFDMEMATVDGDDLDVFSGLTTEQVEEKLAQLASLPRSEVAA